MGTSGWDEESWGRGRAARNGRSDDERSAGRSYDRAGRGGDSYARSYDDERGSGRLRDSGARSSSNGWERSRDDARRPQSGSRGGSSGGWERSGGSGRRPSREDYDGRGERPARGPRGPRDDTWESTGRGRGGMPAGSSGRNRAPGSGGLWEDDARPRRRRPDASDPRAAGLGARTAMRDPRALRRGLVTENAELPEEASGFTAGKAVLVIFLMFVLGAAAGYGYFRYSQPTVHGDTPASSTTTPALTPSTSPSASPSASPKASPNATASPHALAPSGGSPIVLVPATI